MIGREDGSAFRGVSHRPKRPPSETLPDAYLVLDRKLIVGNEAPLLWAVPIGNKQGCYSGSKTAAINPTPL